MESAKNIAFKLRDIWSLEEVTSYLTAKESFILLSLLERELDSVVMRGFSP